VDELRAFGYSKDQKYHCTQVVLALATNETGLPIGYELFAGNMAEVRTLVTCIETWKPRLNAQRVTFVADRALCSRGNLDMLEAGGWGYVVAMPLQRSLKAPEVAQLMQTCTMGPHQFEADRASRARRAEDAAAAGETGEASELGEPSEAGATGATGATGAAAQGSEAAKRASGADDELLWVREFEWEGRRLIVSYSEKRAHKDRADRQAIVDKLKLKLEKSRLMERAPAAVTTQEAAAAAGAKDSAGLGSVAAVKPSAMKTKGNARKLISNSGYLKYIEQADSGGVFVLNTQKLADQQQWDGLHAIVTNDREHTPRELLARYRCLWVIEDSFRLMKHNLAVRPIYHFKKERIEAHIGICFMAFALMRHARQRIAIAQGAMSTEQIKNALYSVQASILEHKKTKHKYRLPSNLSHDAARIYRAFGLSRSRDVQVLQE
jgi:hypothetical protein